MAKSQKVHNLSVHQVIPILITLVIYGLGCTLIIGIATNQPSAYANLPNSSIAMQLPKKTAVDPEIQELVERQAKAWETADSQQIIADFADDGLFIVPGSQFRGKQDIKKAADSYFAEFTETKVTLKRLIVKGNEGAIEWTWSETEKESGKQSQAEDAIIFELEDGKIKYWREYIDKESEGH